MKLLEPGVIGTLNLKNRIIMAPMHISYMAEADGTWGERVREFYAARARGGVGLITTGYFFTSRKLEPATLRYFDLYSDHQLQSLSRVIEGIHIYGTKVSLQLTAGWGRVVSKRRQDPAVAPVGPSPLRCYFTPDRITRPLATGEVEELAQSFGDAAARCQSAGADAVELHGHEGYLLDQFMTGLWNQRDDRYGGNREKRLTFVREIVKAIRLKVGADFPIIYRFGVNHYLKGGRDTRESLWIAKELEAMGIDALHVDAGCYDNHYWPHPPCYQPHGCMADMAAKVKPAVHIPVIAVGRLQDPVLAEKILQSGKADFVAVGRGLLTDPEWVNKVRSGDFEGIRPCIGDGEGCSGELIKGHAPSCSLNPACGHEKEWALTRGKSQKSVLVIGGGPGGIEAALVAAERGLNVTLWERSDRLGGKLWPASVPEFKHDLRDLIKYWNDQIKKLPVEIVLNKEAAPGNIRKFNPDYLILAAGAVPVVPEIPGAITGRVVTAIDVLLNNRSAGKNVVVVGGGLIGCETALYLQQTGRQVTLVECLPDILGNVLEINREMLLKMIEDSHIPVLTGAELSKMTAGGVVIDQNRESKELRADTVVLSVGMRSCNELQKSLTGKVSPIFAVGDCVEPRQILHAVWEAFHCARTLQL